MAFNNSSRNQLDDAGEVFLAKHENGTWKYYSRAELAIPAGPIRPPQAAAALPAAAAK